MQFDKYSSSPLELSGLLPYFHYKAWWSQEPVLHLCERRYEKRVEEETVIKVYSNRKEEKKEK